MIKNLNNSNSRLLKNIFSLGIIQIANYAMPLISVPIISRIIGPENYGSINFANIFVSYFILLIGYGFELTATRKIAQRPNDEQNRNEVFTEVFYAQLFLFLLSVIIFVILLVFVPQLREEKTIISFAFLLCIATLFTQNWLFQAMQDLPKIAILSFLGNLSFTIVVLLVIKRKEDYIWQPLLVSLIQIIISLVSFIWAFKKYNLRFVKVPFFTSIKLLWTEKTIFFSVIIINLYTTTNSFILGLYQSHAQLGYYTAGQRLIVIAQAILTIPISNAFFPYIGKAFGENLQDGIEKVQKLFPFLFFVYGFAGIAMLIVGPYFLTLFYGQKFSPAIPVFRILVFIPLIVSINNLFGTSIMLNLKMDNAFFKISAIGAIVSIFLNFLMIEKWGYIGTSINWLVTELFVTICMYFAIRRRKIEPINFNYFRFSIVHEYLRPFIKGSIINK